MIRFEQVCFGYQRKRPLFENLELSIPAGRICGLLGRNGVGKTTLLKLIAGLRSAWSGRCRVAGHNSSTRPVSLLQDLYFLPEELALPDTTAIEYRRLFGRFFPRFDSRRYAHYLETFEVDSRASLAAASFGQRKKTALAFGLATGCRLILLDEPTNGLDIPAKRQFRRLLSNEDSTRRLMLISTHQARDLEHVIDDLVILDGATVVFHHTLADIRRCLEIRRQTEPPQPRQVLYSEPTPSGYWVVSRSAGGASELDLEILFNTVVANPREVAAIFDREVK